MPVGRGDGVKSVGYLFFRHWNFEINATSRTHASCVSSQLAAFADIFGVRDEFFCPAFIRLNLVTALRRFREQCTFTWRPWMLKCLEATRNWYHICPIWQVFSPGEEIVNWFDLRWRQNSVTTVEHETEWSCYSLPIFGPIFSRLPWPPPPLPTGILYSPQFRSHQETKMAVRRTQRSTSTI